MLMKRYGKKVLIILMISCFTLTTATAFSFAVSGTGNETDADDTTKAEDVIPDSEEQDPVMQEPEPAETEDQCGGSDEGTEDPGTCGQDPDDTQPVNEDMPDNVNQETAPEAEPEEDPFNATKGDYLAYDPLYIAQYADPEYVDVSEVEMERYINVVTAAKGIATYNVREQKDFDVTGSNYIAGMNYEMPVYNVDDDSDYYLAVPDVNLFNGSFRAYDLMLAYNNDFAEMISGYKYEKGILYIPKSAIDDPKNESSVPEGSAIAVQMNYAIGSNMDLTKNIPVQILKKDEPIEKTVHTANLFEQGITLKTGVKNRKEEDISVFLNGHMIPVNENSWVYDKGSGELYIHEMPGVISCINVVFRSRTALEAVKETAVSFLEKTAFESYAAGITTNDMEFFRTPEGEKVVLDIEGGELFVGWRGHYTAANIIHGRQGSQTHAQAEAAKKKLKGWANSVKYLYGGYTDLGGAGTSLLGSDAGKRQFDARIAATWAISSYALGADAGLMNDDGKLTSSKLVTHNVPVTSGGSTTYNSTEKHTIYEWLMKYQNQLKKSNGSTTNNHNNGIAGATNFAVTFPDSIQGSTLSLVSNGANAGRSNDSITITSPNMNSSYYIAASCNHLDDVAASDKDTDMYVTCLGLTDSYVILAFVQARGGQNACAIYKFAVKAPEPPKIRTSAAISDDNAVITDTVTYEKLQKNCKYVFRGWLVDTATGEKIPDSDGMTELSSGTTTSGSVELKMNTSKYDEMTGHSITAFEELYMIETADGIEKETKVAEHKDRTGSAGTNLQIIEIYQDIKVQKNVTGNLGDLTKQFEYTAEFTGLVPGQAYKIEGDDEKTFMADASGNASAAMKLKDGQTAVIKDLPKGATYKVTEAASDHTAEYKVFSEDMADKGARIVRAEASNNTEAAKMLATEAETADLFDGTVVILWENNRDLATLTGIVGPDFGIYAAVLAALAAGIWVLVKRRIGA